MSQPDQLDIKQIRPGVYKLEFDYREDFIAYIKSRVPAEDRSYDPDTHIWEIRGDEYIPAIEGVGVQKFSFATKIFWRGKEQVWRNLKTGKEQIQVPLF